MCLAIFSKLRHSWNRYKKNGDEKEVEYIKERVKLAFDILDGKNDRMWGETTWANYQVKHGIYFND